MPAPPKDDTPAKAVPAQPEPKVVAPEPAAPKAEAPAPADKAEQAKSEPAVSTELGTGTRAAPRKIEMVPPAMLDDAPPRSSSPLIDTTPKK